MVNKQNVRLVIDFICPWSYLGLRKLNHALANIDAEVRKDIHLKICSYQLNPLMPPEGKERKLYRTQKFGSWEKSQQREVMVQQFSEPYDIDFHFEEIERTPNTLLAHKLLKVAAKYDKQLEVSEALFHAYFSKGIDIGRLDSVHEIGKSIGLPYETLKEVNDNEEIALEIGFEQKFWPQKGLTGVPFLFFPATNRGTGVPFISFSKTSNHLPAGQDELINMILDNYKK